MALASSGNLLAGRYRVVGRLGAGGMAVVVLAEDERLGRKVAVKRLHAAEDVADAARRFEREAKLGASLNHPNIVAVYDIDTDDEGVLIVMEYVDGHTLRNEMDNGPMPPARAIEVLCGMAAGLDHAHEHGVVHRDVKPANVLIAARDGTVKLTDLGIATAAERTHITRSGVVLGTAAYMAPERLDGQAGGPAVDIYATAAVAFEMLSGRKAVTGATAMEVARRVMEAPPADLAAAVPGTPVRAAEVLKRGLAKDPAERPATTGELVRDLSAAYAEAARPATRATRAMPEPAAAAAPAADPPAEPAATSVPAGTGAAAAAAAAARVPETSRRARPAPATAAPPAPRAATHRSRPAWLVPAALGAVLAAVLAVLLISSGGGSSNSSSTRDSASAKAAKDPAAKHSSGKSADTPGAASPAPSTTTPAAPSATPPAQQPASPSPADSSSPPAAALESFYTKAAQRDFEGAWALGTDNLHSQFGGSIGTFRGTFATLESISFPTVKVASQSAGAATVDFTSIARHSDRTDRCRGQAAMVAQGSRWLVDHIGVQCAGDGSQAAPGKKPKKPQKAK